jgi:Rieske Fe-S protein
VAHAAGVPEVRREARAGRAPTSRRRFVRGALLGGLGLAAAGAVAGVADFLFPRAEWNAFKRWHVGNVRDFPRGSAPVLFADGRAAATLSPARNDSTRWSLRGAQRTTGGFFLVRLDPAQVDSGGEEGFVALADYCTHLGCIMPWSGDFKFEGRAGWFRCGCHGATFTRAGARVFGPAPRGMDYYHLAIDEDGNLYVDRTEITRAVGNQPAKATPLPQHLRTVRSVGEPVGEGSTLT